MVSLLPSENSSTSNLNDLLLHVLLTRQERARQHGTEATELGSTPDVAGTSCVPQAINLASLSSRALIREMQASANHFTGLLQESGYVYRSVAETEQECDTHAF